MSGPFHLGIRPVYTVYNRFLAGFSDWFSGSSCFWQTTVAVGGVAAIELAFPRLDPHGFWLLWALTLFSAWTQPALAYSGQQGAQKMEALEERVADLEASNGRLLAAIAEKVGVEVEP